MTAGGYGYGYGSMRASDQDRDNVRSILQDAHAEGRLSWDEFDARTTALMNAQTYDQLATLTADLPNRLPYAPPRAYQPAPYGGQRPTNNLAIAALICGVGQLFFWFVAGIPAIVLGHIARRQIRQTGEAGDGMALAGLILGYVGLVFTVLAIIGIAVAVSRAAPSIQHSFPGPPPPPGG
jgi:hypothetical protein